MTPLKETSSKLRGRGAEKRAVQAFTGLRESSVYPAAFLSLRDRVGPRQAGGSVGLGCRNLVSGALWG